MAFYSEEYKHLLLAERVMATALQDTEGKLSERSQCARALVDLVRLKRDIRGVPDPKPVDVSLAGKRKGRRDSGASPGATPVPTDAPKPS
jgi:hypothetical protein